MIFSYAIKVKSTRSNNLNKSTIIMDTKKGHHIILHVTIKILLSVTIVTIMISCSQAKNIAYLQGYNRGEESITKKDSFEYKIKTKDLLSISVVSSEPEASKRYNLITPQIATIEEPNSYLYTQPTLQNYLVDESGSINFPSFGMMHVEGLSKQNLIKLLEEKLRPFFSGEMPIITVRILNFSINVLGEVRNPGKFTSTNERMTIFDGLALAGDMTIYGKRNNVKVIREDAHGVKKIYNVNLSDKSIFSSPVYYLEQNDIVYVEPNKSRANSSMYGEAENYRISTLTVLISVATMATTIFGLIRK